MKAEQNDVKKVDDSSPKKLKIKINKGGKLQQRLSQILLDKVKIKQGLIKQSSENIFPTAEKQDPKPIDPD